MENILAVFMGLFALIFILYPFKVLVRWLAGFLKFKNVVTSFITFGTLALLYLIFITLRSQSIEDILRGALMAITVFVLYLIIDLQKSNEHSKFIKFIHHLAVRIIVSVFTFILVLSFYSQQLHDVLYIKSLLIAIVYVFVILRRRTKKSRKVKNNEDKGTSSPA
ncbi:UNVERIFIED_CONTAM: Na+/pantothenate symporter [Paenibacillus sp. PvR008]